MKPVDEIIDGALRLYRDTLAQTALPAAAGACIGGIPVALALAEGPQPPSFSNIDWSAFALPGLFQLLAGLVVQGMLLKVMALRARNGVQLPVGEALHAGVAMLPALAVSVLLYNLLPALAFAAFLNPVPALLQLMLVVPTAWIAVAGILAAPAVALEGRDGLAALKRSIALVRERWWRTFGLLLLTLCCVLLAYLMLAIAITPLADAAFGGGWPTDVALTTVAGALLTPLVNALLVVVHLDYVGAGQGAPPTQRVDQMEA